MVSLNLLDDATIKYLTLKSAMPSWLTCPFHKEIYKNMVTMFVSRHSFNLVANRLKLVALYRSHEKKNNHGGVICSKFFSRKVFYGKPFSFYWKTFLVPKRNQRMWLVTACCQDGNSTMQVKTSCQQVDSMQLIEPQNPLYISTHKLYLSEHLTRIRRIYSTNLIVQIHLQGIIVA